MKYTSSVDQVEAVLTRVMLSLKHQNGILERSDLLALDVSPGDADRIMAALTQLQQPVTFATQQRNENNNKEAPSVADRTEARATENGETMATAMDGGFAVSKWLESIHLLEYEDVFR